MKTKDLSKAFLYTILLALILSSPPYNEKTRERKSNTGDCELPFNILNLCVDKNTDL